MHVSLPDGYPWGISGFSDKPFDIWVVSTEFGAGLSLGKLPSDGGPVEVALLGPCLHVLTQRLDISNAGAMASGASRLDAVKCSPDALSPKMSPCAPDHWPRCGRSVHYYKSCVALSPGDPGEIRSAG